MHARVTLRAPRWLKEIQAAACAHRYLHGSGTLVPPTGFGTLRIAAKILLEIAPCPQAVQMYHLDWDNPLSAV
eukprot:14814109-Alexandrium_andersonii.AAC.1